MQLSTIHVGRIHAKSHDLKALEIARLVDISKRPDALFYAVGDLTNLLLVDNERRRQD